MSHEESRHITLANHHEAFVQIEKRAGHIVRLAVQVVRFTDGKIQEVYRADNCHGNPTSTRGSEAARGSTRCAYPPRTSRPPWTWRGEKHRK